MNAFWSIFFPDHSGSCFYFHNREKRKRLRVIGVREHRRENIISLASKKTLTGIRLHENVFRKKHEGKETIHSQKASHGLK